MVESKRLSVQLRPPHFKQEARRTEMEYAEAVLKKITESWINEEAFISIDEVIKNL